MFKKRKSKILFSCVALLIIGITVFAKQSTETVSIMFDNIKILIDGTQYTATDANGNVIEPFIYNGTTYLPVRAIANAFDKDVDWEPQTSTVVLGSKNYDWLDQMGYAKYEVSHNVNDMAAIPEGTKANSGIKHDRGLKFFLSAYNVEESNDGKIRSYQTVEYLLNNNYKRFRGEFISLCDSFAQGAIVKFYGDGNLIYTSPILSYGTKDTAFDVDVSGYKVLKIHAEIPNVVKVGITSSNYQVFGIADARLEKK